MAEAITGDLTKQKAVQQNVAAIPFTVVKRADLADIDHPINRTQYSQKQRGYGYVAEDASGRMGLYVATGSEPADVWQVVGGAADGTEDITPA